MIRRILPASRWPPAGIPLSKLQSTLDCTLSNTFCSLLLREKVPALVYHCICFSHTVRAIFVSKCVPDLRHTLAVGGRPVGGQGVTLQPEHPRKAQRGPLFIPFPDNF